MPIPWSLLIALGILVLAYVIKHFLADVIEEERHFIGIVVAFMVVYAAAAVGIWAVGNNASAAEPPSSSAPLTSAPVDLSQVNVKTPTPFEAFLDRIKVKNILP